MNALLALIRLALELVYFFMKLAPVKNRVCMLSRESDTPPLDFLLLEDELKKRDSSLEVVYVCRLLPTKSASPVSLLLNMLACMRALARSKACVTDTYSMAVSMLTHRRGTVIIQIWHALGAVKKFGLQCEDTGLGRLSSMRMHKNYTYITCASEQTAHIYAEAFGTPRERILTLGMPRLDYIRGDSAQKQANAAALGERYAQLAGKTVILYAPTFREGASPDPGELLSVLDTEKYALIVKSHVLGGHEGSGGIIYDDSCVFDLFEICDYVVTDYSAVSFEAAAAGKRLIFWCPDIAEYSAGRGLNINPAKEYPGIAFTTAADVYALISGGSYPYEVLKDFTDKYIQSGGSCCAGIADILTAQ